MRINLNHLGDEIELYALGMLEDDERDRVDAHARDCAACALRLGRAEATVASMVEATIAADPIEAGAPSGVTADRSPLRRPAAAPWRWLANMARVRRSPPAWLTAAVAVFALLAATFAQQNARLRSDLADDGSIFHAMIDSHFSHAQFISTEGAPLPVKVVFERHGGWYEIIAHGIDPQSRVVVVRGASATPYPGVFSRRDDVLVLALPQLGAVSEFRLVDGRGRMLGQARPKLAFGALPNAP